MDFDGRKHKLIFADIDFLMTDYLSHEEKDDQPLKQDGGEPEGGGGGGGNPHPHKIKNRNRIQILDPDPHPFADVKPKCMEYEPI